MARISREDRAHCTRWAAEITTGSHDATVVVRHAEPLVAWVEEAASADDAEARMTALRQQSQNVSQSEDPEGVSGLDDNPGRFLAGARVLYAFHRANPADVPAVIPEGFTAAGAPEPGAGGGYDQ